MSELASGAPKSARRARRSAGALAVVAAVGLSPALAATFDLPTSAGTDGAVDSGQSGTAAYAPVTTDNDIYNLDVANSLTGGDGAKGTPSASGVSGNGGNGGVGIEVDGSNNTFNFDGDVTGGAAGGGGQGLWGSSVGGFPGTAANAIQVDGAANDFNITGNVTGGRGGDGGFGGTSRNGGNGAAAIGVNGTGNTITIDGATLTGGDGGNRGNISGSGTLGGTGGVAVQLNGTDNRLITNGTLNGGNPGVGSSAVANAVQVSGSGNTVELRDGYSFGGDVVVQSGSHTLALGGATGASFDASLLVGSQPAADGVTQFVGFANLEKTGAGTWTVTGTRADNGTTTISEGTLIGSAAALGNGNILNNGSLEMSQTVAGTYTGNMSGTGDFTKTGAESLTLTGTSNHTGGTTISAGTLAIGNGGTAGSITGDVVNNGTLQFNRSDAVGLTGVISGTGSVIQAGSGTTTLSGVNTYTGVTSIEAGTLAVTGGSAIADNSAVTIASGASLSLGSSETIGTLSGAGDISLGSNTLTVNQGLSEEISGSISGSGNLIKSGSADLTLAGNNTFTGSTTINQGQINLYGGSALSDSGAVIMGAGTRLFVGDDETIGSLSGSGEVVLDFGAFSSRLSVGADDSSTTFSGVISGPGEFEKVGSGTLTVSGTNTYTGNTIVSEGTLQANGGAAIHDASNVSVASGATLSIGANEGIGTLSGAGSVALDANTLTVNESAATTFSGGISGTGGLIKAGTENLTLTGTNTYSGGTTISAGTLAIGNGGTAGSITGDVTNNGTLQFNRSDAVGFAGVISGTGGLTQAGSGMLTLTGTSTYSGATTVDAGTLVVNGSIANSTVDVNDGATLMGAGTIGGLNLNSGATLATGNSIDTLTVDGNVVFEAGSIFEVEVEADGSTDVLAATGTATINGGTVDVLASDVGTWSATTDFSILTADGGVTGEFDTVTSNLAFLTPTLSYDANSVQLTLTRNDISFDERARIAPEKAAANALQRIYAQDSSALGDFFPQFLALSVDDAERALQTLNGNSLTTLSRSIALGHSALALQHMSRLTFGSQLLAQNDSQPIYLVSNDDSVTNAAVQAAEARRSDRPKQGIWIETSGAKGDADSSYENYGFESETKAVSVGFDVTLPNNMIGGVALSRLSTDTEFDTVNDDQELDQTYLTLYLQQQRDKLRLNGLIAIGSSDIKTQREIEVGSTRLTAKGDTEGSELYGYAEAGYDMGSGALTWQPVVGLSVADIQVDEFFETGAGDLNLWVEEQKRSSVQSRLGGRLLHKPAGSPFATEFYAFWAHEFADLNNAVSVQFSEAPGTFYTVRDGDRERDALEWGASSLYNISDRATLTARVGGMQSSDERWLSGSLGVQIHW